MINYDNIKIFLPSYLSAESYNILLEELKSFPDNIDNRFYSTPYDEKIILQGDGVINVPIINLPENKIGNAKVIVLSNTCDIDLSNKHYFKSRICYCPIIELNKYENQLKKNFKEDQIKGHINAIKRQEITQIFYLPKGSLLEKEGIVFLDRINNIANEEVERNKIKETRLFSLSNYGFYLFLFKLSIHFTRMYENIDRLSSKKTTFLGGFFKNLTFGHLI